MFDYEKLLEKAKKELPKTTESNERFEIPEADVVTGKHTFVKNFSELCRMLRRDPKHVSKFLFKELAVPGSLRDSELALQGKIYKNIIDQRINEYTKEFVMCKECGKPDTALVKADRLMFVKCEACGARKPARSI